jgi:hypothetical protein
MTVYEMRNLRVSFRTDEFLQQVEVLVCSYGLYDASVLFEPEAINSLDNLIFSKNIRPQTFANVNVSNKLTESPLSLIPLNNRSIGLYPDLAGSTELSEYLNNKFSLNSGLVLYLWRIKVEKPLKTNHFQVSQFLNGLRNLL